MININFELCLFVLIIGIFLLQSQGLIPNEGSKMMENSTDQLGTKKISTLLFYFSVPAILGMLINALYNVVDRIFIGNAAHVGKSGLAGLTISFPIMIILLSIGILFGIGGSTLYSIHLGREEKDQARNTLGNSLVFMIVSSLTLMIIGQIFLEPILIAFGASSEVLPYASSYMQVIFYGAIFQITSLGLNNFVRADGKPQRAMISMLIGAITNIVLDAVFIFGFGMGMEGAALATIIAQLASLLWMLSHFFNHKNPHHIRMVDLKPKLYIFVKVIGYGMPGFLLQLGNSALNLAINHSLYRYGGDNAISAMGVINSLQTFILMPVVGMNQGAKPIVSYNFGAAKYERIKLTMRYANIVATAIATFGWILTLFIPRQLVAIFNQDPELLALGTRAVSQWFLVLPVLGFQIMASNFFQAVGHNKTAIFLTLIRTIILRLPLVLILSGMWGLEGIFYAAPISDLVAVIITGVWYFFGMNSLERYALKKATQAI